MTFDFVHKLPDGINSNVRAIDGILSGGQKQRIALAIALVRKPELLILDKATSALDNIIVIAHRLNTIKDSDKIIVFNDGDIIQEGTYDKLINVGGTYKRYYNLQKSVEKVLAIQEKPDHNNDKKIDKLNDKGDLEELYRQTDEDEFNKINETDQESNVMSAYQVLVNLLKYNKPIHYVIISSWSFYSRYNESINATS